MNAKSTLTETIHGIRRGSRVHCLREITITHEGHDEHVVIRAPDLSSTGMFISTWRPFPEGTVLNLKFRLAVTNAEVRTRCEVRYCLPGVGIGVEFMALSAEAARDIERELGLNGEKAQRKRKSPARIRSARHR